MKCRDVCPVEFFGGLCQNILFGCSGLFLRFYKFSQFHDCFLAFAQQEQVDELSHRLTAVSHSSAGNYEWVVLAAVGASNIDSAKVKHIKHIGEAELIG
jgi:hypothetical protein